MPRVAIVFNPSKFDTLDEVQRAVERECAEAGWERPAWFETDADDAGAAAAERALSTRPDLICAMGGDGTVRVVGSVMRGSDVPLGLLASGTGNLLARNLDLPLNDQAAAMRVALTGEDLRMDVATARTDSGTDTDFLVMSGVGLDAAIMVSTDEGLKKRIGWIAYVLGGAKALFQRGCKARVIADGQPAFTHHAKMVLTCNASSLMGGLEVAHGARLDDGQLDAVLIRPSGLVGWTSVAISMLRKRTRNHALMRQATGERIRVDLARPLPAEVDGDLIGQTRWVEYTIDPASLIVRVAS